MFWAGQSDIVLYFGYHGAILSPPILKSLGSLTDLTDVIESCAKVQSSFCLAGD
jgi:hypothetical protein